MTDYCRAEIGDTIEHKDMPGFPMKIEAIGTCESSAGRDETHRKYKITDPEGQSDWLCAYDVVKKA